MIEIPVTPPIHFFDFQRLHKTLGPGIVLGIAWPAHADRDPSSFQPLHVVSTRVLDAPIGMMNQPRLRLTFLQGRLQGLLGNAAVQLPADAPTHHTSRVDIQNHRQVDELLLQSNVGNIGDPQLIDGTQHHPPRQIRIDAPAMATVGGHHETTSRMLNRLSSRISRNTRL